MKSFVFEVPRIKEEIVEKFLNKSKDEFFTPADPIFWYKKYRTGDKTIYTIWYEDNE